METRAPLAGFNHNIRYKRRVYHVQTEDSGLENPRIFTHLFLDGQIISSARTDYPELAQEPGHEPKVRKLMQDQHKRLMKELRHGEFDDQILQIVGSVDGPAPHQTPSAVEISTDHEVPAAVSPPDESPVDLQADVPDVADVPLAVEVPAVADAEPIFPAAEPAGAQAVLAPEASAGAGDLQLAEIEEAAATELVASDAIQARQSELEPLEAFGDEPAQAAPVSVSMEVEVTEPVDISAFHGFKSSRESRPPDGIPASAVPIPTPEPGLASPTERMEHHPDFKVNVEPRDIVGRSPSSSYSHVFRDKSVSEEYPSVSQRQSAVTVPPLDQSQQPRAPSKIFGKPLPGSPRFATPSEALPALGHGGEKQREAGVYLVPGGPPQRPPHPDPSVRRGRTPSDQFSSSPQQYTAPRRPPGAAPVQGRRRRATTGTYELPSRTPQHKERPLTMIRHGSGPRIISPGHLQQPPRPTAARPLAPPQQRPPVASGSASGKVAARPVVVISQPVHVGPTTSRIARTTQPRSNSSSRITPPPQVAPVQRLGQAPPSRPKGRPLPPQAAEPSSVFGSEVISERSLDEVILAYLAEDSEPPKE